MPKNKSSKIYQKNNSQEENMNMIILVRGQDHREK